MPTTQLLLHLPSTQHGATRSLLEDLLLDLSNERHLPLPELNAIVDGVECDFVYGDLIIEADGFFVHGTRIAFENDHEVRLYLEARGKRVVAVTYRQLTQQRERTADRLERIIRAHTWSSNRS